MGPRGRVLLADPDPASRAGVSAALSEGGFLVVAKVADAAAARQAARASVPGLALLATDLPPEGMETLQRIAAAHPATRVVALTARPDGDELLAAVLAGAVGYLDKGMDLERLPRALEGVLAGEVVLPRSHTGRLLKELRDRDRRRTVARAHTGVELSDRQWEISELLARDWTTSEMAARLGISEVTVRRHVSALVKKLGAGDRVRAAELLRAGRAGTTLDA